MQQTELGQEDVRCEIGVRAAGVEPAALGHVHAQRDVEEQQRDGGNGGGDEQQERVEPQQGRTELDSTAGHIELGRVDEQVLQDGEWQQQECGGGGGDEEHEEQEQLSSGAEVRGHAGEAETVRRSTLKARSNGGAPQGALERRLDAGTFLGGAPLWNVSRGGIMRRGKRGLVGFLGGLRVEGV